MDRDLNRRAFTMVELLVGVSIIGLLMALAIPAVQHSRETSRRLQCQANLKQLGVALANVVETSNAFPTANHPVSGYWRMLPGLEQAALYEALIAFNKRRAPAPAVNVPVFQCPSETLTVSDVGQTSYFFNAGTAFRLASPWNGFSSGQKVDTRPGDVTDGLSNTVAMSERLSGHALHDWPPADEMAKEPRRYFWFTERRYNRLGEELQAVDQCLHHRITTFPQFFEITPNHLRSSFGYDHLIPPNHAGCYNGPEDHSIDTEVYLISASSLHPGGVNALCGDGSVHFVNEEIDAAVWRALGTRSEHESVAIPFE